MSIKYSSKPELGGKVLLQIKWLDEALGVVMTLSDPRMFYVQERIDLNVHGLTSSDPQKAVVQQLTQLKRGVDGVTTRRASTSSRSWGTCPREMS